MIRRAVLGAAVVVAFASPGWCSLLLKIDSGEARVWQQKAGNWTPVKDSMEIALTDSVAVEENNSAHLALGQNCEALLNGSGLLCIGGQDLQNVILQLVQGQLFLKHGQPSDLTTVAIAAQECTFTPVGTAAAVKFTKAGEPTVAVLQGKVRMASPLGMSATIGAGRYGTYDHVNGGFNEGALPENAIAALEKWSGLKLEQPGVPAQAPAAQTSSTPPPAATPPAPPAQSQPPAQQPQAAAAPTPPAAGTTAAAPAPSGGAAGEKKAAEPPAAPGGGTESAPAAAAPAEKPQWELSASNVTVDNEQWTRLALGVDVPFWKFGVFFDLECFIDKDGNFSDKGWRFDKDHWFEGVTRKIRYIRFGHEEEPLFVKIGGLQGVTLGYGFVVDRFTNMLHYPDRKLLGLQFYLNDIGPIGLTLQTLVADFGDFRDDGGVLAARLGIKPLKKTEIPIVSGITVAATYATDLNQYAPAHGWHVDSWEDAQKVKYLSYYRSKGYSQPTIDELIAKGDCDTTPFVPDTVYRDSTARFALAGGDIGIPIIKTSLVGLDLYGQAATRTDKVSGWGFGAPGVLLKVWRLTAQAEYRHTQGRFEPGYFGPYYLDERVTRYPTPMTKASLLPDKNLNGVFGSLGLNIADVLLVGGTYQYLTGDSEKDQRFELTGGIGSLILSKIRKLTKVEGYLNKTGIGNYNDAFFDKTREMYYGYRLGLAITQGASLIWDSRYGFKYDANGKLAPNNNVIIQTAVTF